VEPAQEVDAAGVLMREVPPFGIEARRWTVVFHRRAENWFFAALAMGQFKHVSAFAFIPELGIWTIYDVGFRRTRLVHLADTDHAKTILAHIVKGNCTVTVEARDDCLPLMRAGLFCTTAIKHLIGARSRALRPDRLFRHLVAQGGVVRDDGSREASREATDRGRSELRCRAGEGTADAHR
jgi:hypothetical protein